MLLFWVCVTRHVQSTQNKFPCLCNISRKAWGMKLIFCLQIAGESFLQVDSITLGVRSYACPKYPKQQVYNIFINVCPNMFKLPKLTSLLFLYNMLRKNGVIKLIFCMQISIKTCYELKLWFCWGRSNIPKVPNNKSLQYLKKEVRDEVDFLHTDKHQSFLQVDFNTLGIKVSYKVILSFLMGMIKHSQSTQSNKFSISL